MTGRRSPTPLRFVSGTSAPRAELAGAALLDHFAVVSAGSCRGEMAAPVPITGSAPPAARLRGRLVGRPGGREPLDVVIADAAGVIRGLGITRPASSGARAPDLRWSGYLTAFDPFEPYTAYVVQADGHSACRLRGIR